MRQHTINKSMINNDLLILLEKNATYRINNGTMQIMNTEPNTPSSTVRVLSAATVKQDSISYAEPNRVKSKIT